MPKRAHVENMFACAAHAREEHTASMVSYGQYVATGHEFLQIFNSVSPW